MLAAGHAWLSPLPPEGAAVILHGTPDLAPSSPRSSGSGAAELLADGVVDAVVPEPVRAHEDPAAFVRAIADECLRQIELQQDGG